MTQSHHQKYSSSWKWLIDVSFWSTWQPWSVVLSVQITHTRARAILCSTWTVIEGIFAREKRPLSRFTEINSEFVRCNLCALHSLTFFYSEIVNCRLRCRFWATEEKERRMECDSTMCVYAWTTLRIAYSTTLTNKIVIYNLLPITARKHFLNISYWQIRLTALNKADLWHVKCNLWAQLGNSVPAFLSDPFSLCVFAMDRKSCEVDVFK